MDIRKYAKYEETPQTTSLKWGYLITLESEDPPQKKIACFAESLLTNETFSNVASMRESQALPKRKTTKQPSDCLRSIHRLLQINFMARFLLSQNKSASGHMRWIISQWYTCINGLGAMKERKTRTGKEESRWNAGKRQQQFNWFKNFQSFF